MIIRWQIEIASQDILKPIKYNWDITNYNNSNDNESDNDEIISFIFLK